MNVGIDARMYGPHVGGGGLGRYVEQLVLELGQLDHKHRFVLFLKNEEQRSAIDSQRFETRLTDIHWYTLREQLSLHRTIDREKLDLIHFPHWNVPMKIRTPFVVTIHDLILLEEPRSAKATTRNPLIYKAKYAGYRRVLNHALTASRKIIAVSEYTKNSILKHFPEISKDKIVVVYEGLTMLSKLTTPDLSLKRKMDPYFLYVGNAYPHKNLNTLIEAFNRFHLSHPDINLVLAGRDDVFYQNLKADVNNDAIEFVMSPTDKELAHLYRGAHGYLFPSRCEGFGLPPLEAMSFSVPVAASNTSCLPEILGDAAIYFSPESPEEMIVAMEKIFTDESLRKSLIDKGHQQIKKYSWSQMARETLTIYESA